MVSVAALVAELGIEDDGTLEDLIERATAFISSQTLRYFGLPEEEICYLAGTGGRTLWLAEPPAEDQSVPYVITVFEREFPGATETEIIEGDPTGFELRLLHHRAGLIRRGGCVWRKDREYVVTFVRGYVIDQGPADIRQLVIDFCALKHAERDDEGLKSETIGAYSYTAFGPLDIDQVAGARETLEAWRRSVYA